MSNRLVEETLLGEPSQSKILLNVLYTCIFLREYAHLCHDAVHL